LRALVASLLCAFCIPHVLPQVVFFAVLIGGLSYVCGPAVHAWWTAGRSAERRVANRDIGALPV
jgi:hypothetical protein